MVWTPLLSWHILIIEPKYWSGVIIVDFIQGSSINLIWVGSGNADGFCKFIILSLLRWTLYTTPGVVVN